MAMVLIDALWRRVKECALVRVCKNALALLIAQAGAKVLNLVLVAQLARGVGVAGLGRYLMAITVEAVALAVVDLGINTFTIREFSRERPPEEADALLGTVFGLKLLAALCGILALNVLMAPIFFPGERRVLIAISSLALLPDAFNGVATAWIKARQRMEVSSAITLAIRFIAAFSGVLLVRLGNGERALLISYGATSLLGSVAFAIVLHSWRARLRWTGFLQRWGEVWRESVPFAITGMVAILYTRMDLLMLSHWQGDLAAGLYGAAYRLWEALGVLPSSFLDALFPELSRVSDRRRGQARLRALYDRGRLAMWFVIALLVMPCLLAAPHAIVLLYGRRADITESTMLFRGLLLSFPFTYLYLLNGHTLYAVGQQRRVTGIMVAVAAFKGLLNALAIPAWSYWGAVGVVFISEALLFVLLRVASERFALRPRFVSNDGG